jgi:flagellar motor switch protein FliM
VTNILDQSEVAALLAAVETGQVQHETTSTVSSSRGKSQIDVQAYDFRRPQRVSKGQIRGLDCLHDSFARSFGAALSADLRTGIEISVAHIEQLAYSEFIGSLANPTCFSLLRAEQLEGRLCLEISPLIIYPMIDRLLGGSDSDAFIPQRPLTQIERRLVQRITDRASRILSAAWSNLTPVEFKVEGVESNPELVQIAPPHETVVVVRFNLRLGNCTGMMSLCLPCNAMEPILPLLTAPAGIGCPRKDAKGDHLRKLTQTVGGAAVEMRVILARTTLRMNDLLSLQPGDIITTEKECTADAIVQVEERQKFCCQVGQFRGNRAVKITRVLNGSAVAVAGVAPGEHQ